MNATELRKIAENRRLNILEMDYHAQTGHIGGAMSCIDILTCLFYQIMDTEKLKAKSPARDRFVLSKGHCAEALYAVLGDLGLFPKSEWETYAQFHTRLAEHPTRKLPGVELSTGALGHGLSAGVGMALGAKSTGAHVYVLMGDGEQAEGSNWEACMAASKYRLDNLTAIVDRNRLQITGSTEAVMPLDDLAAKYAAFGFYPVECDGHDPVALEAALHTRAPGKPVVVIADTVKGKGVSFMENIANWHHQVPTTQEYEQAKQEITARLEALK